MSDCQSQEHTEVEGSRENRVDESSTLLPRSAPMDTLATRHHVRRQYITIFLCALAVVFVDMGSFLATAPQLRLFESIVCRDYYKIRDPSKIDPQGDIPEHLCKLDFVQDEIAFLDGFQMFFDNIPALFLSLPYGLLAERWGRKPVLVLNFLGLTIAPCWILFVCFAGLPIRLIWFSSMAYVVGGGPTMAGTVIMMMIADVTRKEQRANIFFQIQATVLISELVAPPIGSLLMKRNVWYAMFLGLAIQTFCIGVALLIRETRDLSMSTRAIPAAGAEEAEPCIGEEEDGEVESIRSAKLDYMDHFRNMMGSLRQHWDVVLLVLTFLISSIGRSSLSVFLQYVSKRYGWILANANYLVSFRAVMSLVLLVAVLPMISTMLVSRAGMDAARKDLAIARTSIMLMVSGFFIIAVSPTVATMIMGLFTYTLGTGFSASVRSVVTLMVMPEHVPRLYTFIALSDTVGSLVAGPFLSLTFHFALRLGGAWLGLPFLVSAFLLAMVALLVFNARVPETVDQRTVAGADPESVDLIKHSGD